MANKGMARIGEKWPVSSQFIVRVNGSGPYHVFFQVSCTKVLAPQILLGCDGCPEVLRRVRSEASPFVDGRSDYHARVGYRMNACRRGAVSD